MLVVELDVTQKGRAESRAKELTDTNLLIHDAGLFTGAGALDVHTVVLWLVALPPAHHARLVPEVPVDAPEHRRRLHPNDLLVVEDAEVAPDALDVAAAL
ncbi:MAG: hypothetical protein ABIP94_20420, partial [Planctomycetota bacterium]